MGFNCHGQSHFVRQGIKSEGPARDLRMSKESGAKELYVKKIRNGSVIDHISAGHALDVLKILGIGGGEGHVVSVAMNVSSKAASKKDIVKVENRELRSEEHTSELQSQSNLVCRLLLEKKKASRGRFTA